MEKKWISFDLDGTLMQNPFPKWVFPEIKRRINAGLDEEKDITKLLVAKHHEALAAGKVYEAYDWDGMTADLLRDLSLEDVFEIDVEAMVREYSVEPKVYLLEEGIPETLAYLREQGFSLAVVTNGFYKYQFPVLEALGIDGYFDEIITPEETECAKPDVEIFDGLLKQGELVAHVGDRVDHDIVVANELHTMSVFIHKKLPEYYRDIPLKERVEDEGVLAVVREKWAQETEGEEFHDLCLPDVVIGSIGELRGLVK